MLYFSTERAIFAERSKGGCDAPARLQIVARRIANDRVADAAAALERSAAAA